MREPDNPAAVTTPLKKEMFPGFGGIRLIRKNKGVIT